MKPTRDMRRGSVAGARCRRGLLAFGVVAVAASGCKAVQQELEHVQPISLTTGVIRGRVMNPNAQQPVAGASVTLLGQDSLPVKNQTSVAYTGQDGQFRFPNALPGTYRLRAEAEGFTPSLGQTFLMDAGTTYSTDLVVIPRGGDGPGGRRSTGSSGRPASGLE